MSRVACIITCPRCSWRAKLVGDTTQEVAEFLSRKLDEHDAESHPEVKQ